MQGSVMRSTVILLLLGTIFHALAVNSEGSPGFFLKITKNIPRLGRSPTMTNFEKYIMKTSRNVPRIGRRDQSLDPNIPNDSTRSWNNNEADTISKRMSDNFNVDHLHGYHLIQPLDADSFYDVLSRDMLDSHRFRFVAWKDFDQALEEDPELYGKLLSIGKEANLNLAGDSKKFVPLFGDLSNNDLIYYRADRDINEHGDKGQKEYEE